MVNWQSRLWKRWISKLLARPMARRRVSGQRRRLAVERLEERLVPAIVSSVAADEVELSPPPLARDDFASTAANAPVTVDVLANDEFYRGTRRDSSSLTIGSDPVDGTVKVQQGPFYPVVVYLPNPTSHVLVVDDPRDVNDGNFSPGHLSLREAIWLANAGPGLPSDSFTYTVRANDGAASEPATVTINFTPTTTITFSPRLRGRRLSFSEVADASVGNTALVITSSITIEAPTQGGLTLVGLGRREDLRLFRVMAGGNLTLRGLTMTNWSTDTNGGVLVVDPSGIASLTDCTLSNNSAASQGGAIFNLSFGVRRSGGVTLTNCTLAGNRAHDGGAYNGGGQTYGGIATFSNCILRDNTAVDRGGAIALYNSNVFLTNCTLAHNSAHQGGGIAGGYIVLDHSTLVGNTAVDGGGIFSGVGGGASNGLIVQVGGPGGVSDVELESCTLTGNSAQHRGGGLYLAMYAGGPILNCKFTGNRAQQGGGLFLDNSEPGFLQKDLPELLGTVFSGNSASATGGGIFINNGSLTIDGWTFANNIARQGAALFNNLGSVTVTDSTVMKNRSQQGTQLFNHLGILSLTNSTVSDIARMTFLSTDNISGTQFAAANPGLEPAAVAPPPSNTIVTGADGIRWALTPDRLLLRQLPGCNWAILDDLVQSYKIAPHGEAVWLNDRGDLLRSHAGRAGDLIGQLVQSFAMDKNGTVYDLSTGAGPGNFALYRSLTAPLLDPVVEVEESDERLFCLTPPTGEEVLQAAGLEGSAILNPRVVVEPIVDRMDGLSYFPNIGLAQMHHCHYKCTIYYDTELNGSLEGVIYIDKDYLFRVVPDQVSQSTRQAQDNAGVEMTVGSSGTRESSNRRLTTSATTETPVVNTGTERLAAAIATVPDANRSDNIRSLWTGPDGTIYKLGGDYNGQHLVGTPPLPLVLWRLPPGGNWEPLLRVSAAEVAPDNTLFVLNTKHELQRLAPGASQWTTVARGVQSFTMTKEGTVFALDVTGRLLQQQHAPHSTRWVLSTLDRGVQSFAVTADGVVYDLNNRNELNRFTGDGQKFARLQSGVSSLQQAADGAIYTLNRSGQLKRLGGPGSGLQISFLAPRSTLTFSPSRDSNPPRVSIVTPKMKFEDLTPAFESFQLDADGVLYALSRRHELLRLTPGNHWSLVDVEVQSFVLAPNGLRNVYTLSTHQELKRLEAGYSWRTLRTDAVSLSIDAEGTVTARDRLNRSWMYWSPFTAPALDPVEGENAPIFCQDAPTRDDVLRLTHIPDGPDVNVIVEPTVDTVDPPRWFPTLGEIGAQRLHHCQYQCTVQYTNANGPQTVVIDIDSDHLIRFAGPGS